MSEVCWLSERDAQLARARRLVGTDVAAALRGSHAHRDVERPREVAPVRAAQPSDPRALIDRADLERDVERARALYERAIDILESRGARAGAGGDLDAARRGRAVTLVKEAS